MVWFVLLHLLRFVVDLLTTTRRTDRDKDVEILLLRHQLRLLRRERAVDVGSHAPRGAQPCAHERRGGAGHNLASAPTPPTARGGALERAGGCSAHPSAGGRAGDVVASGQSEEQTDELQSR